LVSYRIGSTDIASATGYLSRKATQRLYAALVRHCPYFNDWLRIILPTMTIGRV